jgi:hypothetical protein
MTAWEIRDYFAMKGILVRPWWKTLAIVILMAIALPTGAVDWTTRTSIRYPWLKHAVTLKECDRRQVQFTATGTMTIVSCYGRDCKTFIWENSCDYRPKDSR